MHHHHHWKAIKYSCFINSFNSQKGNFSAVSVLVAIMCFLLAPSNVIFNVSSSNWCSKLTQMLSCNIFHPRLFCATHKFNSDHKNSCHIRNRNITKRRAKSSSSFLNSKMCKMSGMKLKQQYYAFSASRTKNRLNINFFFMLFGKQFIATNEEEAFSLLLNWNIWCALFWQHIYVFL